MAMHEAGREERAAAGAARPTHALTVRLWRGAEAGRFVTYRVPARDSQTVLDVVTEVQRRHAPDLAYRFACRVGVCGTCAMTVNGIPRWTCRTHVRRVARDGALTIEPLRSLPRIRDLVVDLAPFFERWDRAGGRFVPTRTRAEEPARVDPESPERRAVDAAIECINCAVCHAACDVVAADADYLGPAPLLRAWTLVNDVRHGARPGTLARATGQGGCASCHAMGNCMKHCPVGLSPAEGIAGLKRLTLLAALGRR